MELFAVNQEVAQLEAQVLGAPDAQDLTLTLTLAWQLRQRDCQRALILADQAERLLEHANLPQIQRQSMSARLNLVRAWVKWLFGELDSCQIMAEQVRQSFAQANDLIGYADAYDLLAWVAYDQGDMARTRLALETMALTVENIDPVRLIVARAALARFDAFTDVAAARQRWSTHFSADCANLHPAAACSVQDYFGIAAKQSGDYVAAIQYLSATYTLALETGQLRCAVTAACNAGDAFNSLNDHRTALEWMQCGLDLARQSTWPGTIGFALMQTAETMRRLQSFDAAVDMLREALSLMNSMRASRSYALALLYLGDVELDRKQYASALDAFQILEQRALALGQVDLLSRVQRGEAQALLGLGQAGKALQAANAALEGAQSNPNFQIAALRVLADIYVHPYARSLPAPSGMTEPGPVLHYMRQALALAAAIADYIVPASWFDVMAQEYARSGDYVQAYQVGRQAGVARDRSHALEAGQRVIALQVRYQIEQARAEAEHHRQLARTQAERAEALAESLLALRAAQAQLLQQEKLASLGSLVAGFAHQLNTPVAAIKSGSKSIIGAFYGALTNLPALFGGLDKVCQSLFITLLCQRQQHKVLLSTRDERSQTRSLAAKLERKGMVNARRLASCLVQLRALAILDQIMPLLRHPACDQIIEQAYLLAMIPNSAFNIESAADQIANIILALKSLSGVDQNKAEQAVSLQQVIEVELAQHQGQMHNKVILVRDYQTIPPLACLPDQLRQVWSSLIRNALQAMQYEGTLTVSIRRHGDEAVVAIQDSGVGIDEAIRDKIFDAFFTTKTLGEGSGLGLAIVQQIVERHRGRIEVESVPGQGTTFRVCLPYNRADQIYEY